MKRRPPQLEPPYPRQRRLSPEEADLWRQETGEEKKSLVKGEKRVKGEAGDRVKRTKTPVHPLPSSSSPSSFSSTLDLHGHTQAGAHAALLRFIEAARAQGLRRVIVITGKGKGPPGQTLRELLPRWLEESPLRGMIMAYDTAAPRQGGDGAWHLRLRQRKPKP